MRVVAGGYNFRIILDMGCTRVPKGSELMIWNIRKSASFPHLFVDFIIFYVNLLRIRILNGKSRKGRFYFFLSKPSSFKDNFGGNELLN
jgi:hypothetical protein